MRLSLMTISMYGNMLFKFEFDQDMEDILETYIEMMELIKETGYEAVDVTSLETTIFTANGVKSILNKNNLKVSSYIYFDEFASNDENTFQERLTKAKQAIYDAKTLETNVVMLVPKAHEGIEANTPEEIRKQLIKHFRPIVEYANQQNVTVVVENTPDLKLHFCSVKEVKQVIDAVPGLKLVYDSGNMILVNEDPLEYFDKFKDSISHIHLKDMRSANHFDMFVDVGLDGLKWACASTGLGVIDLKSVIKRVKSSGYDGYLTVEFSVEEDNDYRKSLIRSREYLEELI